MKRRTPTDPEVRKDISRGPSRPQRAMGRPTMTVSPETAPRTAVPAKLIDLG
jgi:hypothetical protein